MNYSFTQNPQKNVMHVCQNFSIDNDEYELFWTTNKMIGRNQIAERLTDRQIAEKIWDAYISQIGVS